MITITTTDLDRTFDAATKYGAARLALEFDHPQKDDLVDAAVQALETCPQHIRHKFLPRLHKAAIKAKRKENR